MLGRFKQGVNKQRIRIFVWRPGSHYHVAATRRADTVLASDCRAQFGRPSTRDGMLRLCDSTVAGLAMWRDNVLASKCE